MNKYLNFSNFIFLALACSLGLLFGSIDHIREYFSDKYRCLAAFVLILSLFYILIEINALRKIPSSHRGFWINGNPFLKVVAIKLALLIVGGGVIVARFELGTLLSHVTLAALCSFFVAGIFETLRLLRGR